MTPKRVADRHRADTSHRFIRRVRHWGQASAILYNAEVPVDVVFLDRAGTLYLCYWRGQCVAAYCPELTELSMYLPDLLSRAIELMTPTERHRHKEELPDIDIVQNLKQK